MAMSHKPLGKAHDQPAALLSKFSRSLSTYAYQSQVGKNANMMCSAGHINAGYADKVGDWYCTCIVD